MLTTVEILLPIFALILAGFLCRKRRIMGPTAASELNKVVVWLALPALLFDVMAHATWTQMDQPAFIAAFALVAVAIFLVVLIWRMRAGRHLADASIDAIAAAYPNTGYIGFPLGMVLYGAQSHMLATIATIIVACVLFAGAIVLIEIGVQTERQPLKLAWKVVKSLAKNPLIVSPIAGGLVAAVHLSVPQSAEMFLKLLGDAASPCALISLGLFLAEDRPSGRLRPTTVILVALKLIGQPLLTWWIAGHWFGMSGDLLGITVMLAALPTGTGPFMLAEFYKREAVVTSQVILLTTVCSLLTLTVLLVAMGHVPH
ncbi:AEC family transporter [Robbsia sp. KACC 23696]|uniref:AEC family transporter n=1 Tax=Robbsia sp. KACC 23696 TaxID=3149231 RepID=UPI00325B389A